MNRVQDGRLVRAPRKRKRVVAAGARPVPPPARLMREGAEVAPVAARGGFTQRILRSPFRMVMDNLQDAWQALLQGNRTPGDDLPAGGLMELQQHTYTQHVTYQLEETQRQLAAAGQAAEERAGTNRENRLGTMAGNVALERATVGHLQALEGTNIDETPLDRLQTALVRWATQARENYPNPIPNEVFQARVVDLLELASDAQRGHRNATLALDRMIEVLRDGAGPEDEERDRMARHAATMAVG